MTVSRKTLHILGNNSPLTFTAGENLLDILNANKVSIAQSCGGFATCTTCHVYILKGLENCSPRNEVEAETAEERVFPAHERLACQTILNGDVEIEILNPFEDFF